MKRLIEVAAMVFVLSPVVRAQFPGVVVHFPDANLEAAVKNKLGISVFERVTRADMLNLTSLPASNRGITDLTGLEYATNLQYLDLDGNQISDLSPLAGLTNLGHLELGGNQISDLSPLAGLTNLGFLDLYGNQISNLSPLAGLMELQILDLRDNQITNLSSLAGLTNLTGLFLDDNQITTLSALAGLTKLADLYLRNNQISDLSPLAGLTHLTNLDLGHNQISDLSPFAGLTELMDLCLYENPLNQEAYSIYIPLLKANNPYMWIYYDPYTPAAVPNVVGMNESQATSTITGAGLVVGTKTSQCNNTVPAGQVISQSPSAGTSVSPGSAVSLSLSSGPCPETVPNVVGMNESQAASTITAAGLVAGTTWWSPSDTVPVGEVISQSPPAGSSASHGSAVDLTISTGTAGLQQVSVPNVVGMSQSQAAAAITAAGLAVGTISPVSSDTVAPGNVISQNPAAGTSAPSGSAVNLVVCAGAAPVGPALTEAVAHWKLDETEGPIAFDSVGANDGVLHGNPVWLPDNGMIDGALLFDGLDDYVNCGTFDPSAATGKLTVCLWANWTGPNGRYQGLIGKRDSFNDQEMMWQVEITMETGNLTFKQAGDPGIGAPILPIGVWVHVAATFDGTTARLYLNGVQSSSGTFSLGSGTAARVVFGACEKNGGNPFNGALDDVRLYDQVLSKDQIEAVMTGEATGPAERVFEGKDIGTTGGSDSYEDGVYTVVADGGDICCERDEFRYVYAPVTGDFEMTAHVLSLENTDTWAKAGVMVREVLEPTSRHALMSVTPEPYHGCFEFICRSAGAGTPATSFMTVQNQVAYPANTWVKIRRQGNTFTGLVSTDGTVWQVFPGPYATQGGGQNPVTIDMPQTVYVGLAVTSHSRGTLCTAQFDNVVISTGARPEDLVAHWAFDETAGRVAPDSVGGFDGALLGGPVWQPAGGKVGGALMFDGLNDCVLTDFVLDPAKGPFSVFAWIKGGAPGEVIVSQDGAAGGTDWLAASSTGRLTTAVGGRSLSSSKVITDDQWHEIGLTWDDSSRTLYIDGAVAGTDRFTGSANSAGGLNIGAGKNLDTGTFFTGLIDDVRIYNGAIRP